METHILTFSDAGKISCHTVNGSEEAMPTIEAADGLADRVVISTPGDIAGMGAAKTFAAYKALSAGAEMSKGATASMLWAILCQGDPSPDAPMILPEENLSFHLISIKGEEVEALSFESPDALAAAVNGISPGLVLTPQEPGATLNGDQEIYAATQAADLKVMSPEERATVYNYFVPEHRREVDADVLWALLSQARATPEGPAIETIASTEMSGEGEIETTQPETAQPENEMGPEEDEMRKSNVAVAQKKRRGRPPGSAKAVKPVVQKAPAAEVKPVNGIGKQMRPGSSLAALVRGLNEGTHDWAELATLAKIDVSQAKHRVKHTLRVLYGIGHEAKKSGKISIIWPDGVSARNIFSKEKVK